MHGEDSSNWGDGLVTCERSQNAHDYLTHHHPTGSDIPALPLHEEDMEQCSEAAAVGYWNQGEAQPVYPNQKLRGQGA